MRSYASLIAMAGIAFAVSAAGAALFGWWALAFLLASFALGCALVVSLGTHRQLVGRTKAMRERAQADRRAIIGEIRTAKDSADKAASSAANAARLLQLPPSVGNSFGVVASLGGVGPEYEYGERATTASSGLETFALRARSSEMRHAFARAASQMQYDCDDVLRILRTTRVGRMGSSVALASWDVRPLLALARIIANQRILQGDIEDAEVVFDAARTLFGINTFGKTDAYIYAEVLGELGRYADALAVLKETKVAHRDPTHHALVVANGCVGHDAADWDTWSETIRDLYVNEQLAPIRVDLANERAPLDCLSTCVTARTLDGPMVSILIPTYKGSRRIATALDSLISQTWRNLEIIVVDDFSPIEDYEELVEVCSRYPDVTLLRQGSNQGAYPARNLALTVARGDFVTVHDDDDWSHAEKIAVQVQHLLSNEDQVANMTRHARATEELVFTRINNNPSFSQPNFSSLMFRRELLGQIGIWDEVNRGADAEFRDRIVQASGRPVEVLLAAPMSFTRTHVNSLTSGEIGRGYIDPSRLFYQAAYQHAHFQATNATDLRLAEFARPLNMQPGQRGKHLGRFDVVFASDFCFPGGTVQLTLNEVAAAAAAGKKVGVLQLNSPVNGGSSRINSRALEVVRHANIEVLSLTDELNVSLMVIRHPTVVQYTEELTSRIRADRVVLIVNNPPVLSDGTGYVFEFSAVRANVKQLFGVLPDVMAESGVTRLGCQRLARQHELKDAVWPGFIDVERFSQRIPDFSSKPVLGRHSRDAKLKWPDLISDFEAVYGSNDVFDVRILGGVEQAPAAARDLMNRAAEVLPFGSLAPEDFLSTVDFWSYFHSERLTESFGMATVEAMASGLVVILPFYMEENFGNGAIYAEPSQVRDIVQRYWADPELYRRQSARARRVVLERFSQQAFLQRLDAQMALARNLNEGE